MTMESVAESSTRSIGPQLSSILIVRLKDTKLMYLHYLLSNPGRQFSAIDHVAVVDASALSNTLGRVRNQTRP